MNSNRLRYPSRRGFALIEAVIAMLVVAVGLLILGATFLKLTRAEDVARQQGEATRLVEERIEAMRAYTQITAANGVVSWNGLAGGSDSFGTDTVYTRSWALGGSSADTMRTLRVTVDWTDRAGEAQTISMATVVSRTDPSDVGSLGFPLPANTTLKRPKNRNLNIPVPASDLGNGESAFRLPNTNYAVVFSNETGYVVKSCSLASGVTNITLDDLSDCSDASAYILAGYISLHHISTFPTSLAINASGISGESSVNCSISNAVDQTSGASIAGYKYYLCVISVPAAGDAWSGSLKLAAPTLNTGSNNFLVCRFQFPSAAGITANQRNVQPYANVAESLDSQNYLITDDNQCPTVSSLATTLHQRCRSDNGNRAPDCPSS